MPYVPFPGLDDAARLLVRHAVRMLFESGSGPGVPRFSTGSCVPALVFAAVRGAAEAEDATEPEPGSGFWLFALA